MNTKQLSSLPFSVLDPAVVLEGKTVADTFKNSVSLAQHTEALGYERYWLAEHHNITSIASSATSVLIGLIAEHTNSMRVGAGGIMLPNHSPLIIAEQFGTLATLYPDRIDLGLGRAPGTDQLTAMEIRGERFSASNNFEQDMLKLQKYLSASNSGAQVRAIPGEGTDVPIWILGSSTESAYLAASYGLPYAFASHFAPTYFLEAIQTYRQHFRPSIVLDKPYIMACVNVFAADTDKEAERLGSSLKRFFMGIVTGKRQLLQPPVELIDDVWDAVVKEAVNQMLAVSFIGGPEKLKAQFSSFLSQTQIDEVMVTSHIYDHEAKLYSYQLFAEMINKG